MNRADGGGGAAIRDGCGTDGGDIAAAIDGFCDRRIQSVAEAASRIYVAGRSTSRLQQRVVSPQPRPELSAPTAAMVTEQLGDGRSSYPLGAHLGLPEFGPTWVCPTRDLEVQFLDGPHKRMIFLLQEPAGGVPARHSDA
ncbi:hypothetical protein PIB30_083456 [Stylosanthes scabra]|uniref:Uncharacterized protein n=1 Tax=Stylosanthes scabra TaxID=79078 RepID=A0ABU6ZQZ5_9FABA|nr:hypothetical protein [Stylosanthes scabra]